MGVMANNWKKAKEEAEKAVKEAVKQKKKASMPTFKADFQKTLDQYESLYKSWQEAYAKAEKFKKEAKTLGEQCEKILDHYRSALKSAEPNFDGPTTRASVLDPMKTALTLIERTLQNSIPI